MKSQTQDQDEGDRLKIGALALLADRREAVIRRAQRALLTVLLETGLATADDVRELVKLPPGIGPKCFGAVPLALARAGIIQPNGFRNTARREGHARPVTVWRLADRAAALRWLADHPDVPDPGADQGDGSQGLLFLLTPNEATPTASTAGAGN
jgi:hypothetical protein